MPKFARPNSYNGRQSTQNWTGDTRSATESEALNGVSTQVYISPKTLDSVLNTLVNPLTATLAAGTSGAIANTSIQSTDVIIPFHIAPNASTELGVLTYTINPGVSFTISSRDPTDASVATGDLSTIGYLIVRQV